jgi:putative transposase
MQLEVTVPEVFNIFKEISEAPEKLFDMMRLDLREMAGDTLTALMEWELTLHLGRKRYERREGGSNHRNGSYPRRFTMKGIGEVEIKVPRDRQGTFKTAILPKGRQYEEALAQDFPALCGRPQQPQCGPALPAAGGPHALPHGDQQCQQRLA